MEPFAWQRATSVSQAAAAATHTVCESMLTLTGIPKDGQAVVIKAGGVDLLALMKEGLVRPARLIDITRLPELEGITVQSDGGVRIGALATLGQIAAHADLQQGHTALAQAASLAASPQIRSRATIGGNLLQRPRCWYLRSAAHHCLRKAGAHCFAYQGDNRHHAVFANHGCAIVHASTPATALLALDAEVEIAAAAGGSRRVPLAEFFLLPASDVHRETALTHGEILTAVWLPPPGGRRSLYLQVSERAAFDWPLAAVAVALDIDPASRCRHASIVLGAAAPVPWRARDAEAVLAGALISEELAASAGEAALAGATPLSRNAYKLPLLATLVRRAVSSIAGLQTGSPAG